MDVTEASQVGRDTILAYRFLRETYGQIRGLLKSVDRLMADRGWHPTNDEKVTYDISDKMGGGWLATWFLRIYLNSRLPRTICGFEIYLDPPVGFARLQ